MNCSVCQALLPPGASACPSCGAPVSYSVSPSTSYLPAAQPSYQQQAQSPVSGQTPFPTSGLPASGLPTFGPPSGTAQTSYGLPAVSSFYQQQQPGFLVQQPPQQPPTPQEPERQPGLPGPMVALIVILAMLLVGGGIFAYYLVAIQPEQQHAQATVVARNFLTAQAQSTAQAGVNATTHAQATATATTPQDIYTQATSGTPSLNDPLNNKSASTWSETGNQKEGCVFTGGSYHIGTSQQGLLSCFAGSTNVADFAFQVQMTVVKGDAGGISFRIANISSNAIDAYFFEIAINGAYSFLIGQNGPLNALVRGTSPSAKQGLNQSNQLTVIAKGSSIYLYVNKQFVTSINDGTFASGRIGLFVTDIQNPSEVAFSNAEIWTL